MTRKTRKFFKRQLRRITKPIIPKLVYFAMILWFATCRVREHNNTVFHDVLADGKTGIGFFWHYSIVFMLYHLRQYGAAVMVSASSDGDYLANVAQLLGFQPIRGSRHKRGLSALKEMVKVVKDGSHGGLVADGSQGPVFKVQPGAILIASKTGSPLIPLAWSASKYFKVKSWDRTAFPLPFSRVDYFYGDPITIPPGLSSEDLEKYRIMVEEKMNTLYSKAWSVYDKAEH